MEPGTFVLCLEPKHRKGLSAHWQGPYLIKKRLDLQHTYLMLDTDELQEDIGTPSRCINQRQLMSAV